MEDNECCPRFDPERWNEKTFKWNNKRFIKDTIPTVFHMPFPPMIGKKISKMWKMAEDANKTQKDNKNTLVLFSDPSPFRSEIFVSVTGEVPNANNIRISGTYMSKVFDGPYNAIPKFIKEMDGYLSSKGKSSKKYLVHYAYCPKCARKYLHNHMILFAEI